MSFSVLSRVISSSVSRIISKVLAIIEISVLFAMVLCLVPVFANNSGVLSSGELLSFDKTEFTQLVAAEGLNQRLENARFRETTPDFTDLYIIHTHDKGREITIYCSATHCYKGLKKNYPA